MITGALPYLAYSQPSSAVISTGVAPTSGPGGVATVPATAELGVSAGGARAMMTASGTTILFTWLILVAVLVAANILTLRIQG